MSEEPLPEVPHVSLGTWFFQRNRMTPLLSLLGRTFFRRNKTQETGSARFQRQETRIENTKTAHNYLYNPFWRSPCVCLFSFRFFFLLCSCVIHLPLQNDHGSFPLLSLSRFQLKQQSNQKG